MAWSVVSGSRSQPTRLLTLLNLGAPIWNHEMCIIYLALDQIFFWSDVVTTELKQVFRGNASPIPRLSHHSFHLKPLVRQQATQCILTISESHFPLFSFPTTEICWECHNCFSLWNRRKDCFYNRNSSSLISFFLSFLIHQWLPYQTTDLDHCLQSSSLFCLASVHGWDAQHISAVVCFRS